MCDNHLLDGYTANDEAPSCPRCNGDNLSDDIICRACRVALDGEPRADQFVGALAADDDGETFVPMSEEEMAFAQAEAELEPLGDPFEEARDVWPNIFYSPAISETMAKGAEVAL